MRKTAHRKLEATAYHEAGHAVVGLEFDRKLVGISITPDGESLGRVQFEPPGSWFQPDAEIEDRHRIFIDQEVLIDLAGDAAWLRFRGRRNRIGSKADNRSAYELAARMFDDRTAEEYMRYMRQRAVAIVGKERNWIRIEALAKVLVDERDVSPDRVREVCVEALRERGRALGIRSFSMEHETPKMDDRAGALADFLIEQFPPESAAQQFYLVDFAEAAIAEIERDLPREDNAERPAELIAMADLAGRLKIIE